MTNLVSLYKGQYAGEIADIHYLQGLTIGLTLYPKQLGSNPLHYHQNQHISLLLEGGQELLLNDSYKESSVQMLLLDLVSNGTKGTPPKKPSWVCLLEQLLQDRWNEVLTLKELSVLTGVHPVTISKYFTTYFACTLGEYRRKLKITKSIPLIRNPDLSLTDIAYICGFSDQSHFIRTFKELTGWLLGKFQGL